MSFMVQDLLDYSQIKAGKFRQNYSVFDIKDTINKVKDILRQKADEKNIKFFATFENLGSLQEEEDSPYIINCDEHRIMQVLLGLLSNALKFTDQGEVETVVKIIKDNSNEEFLSVTVKDTGVGIAKED